MIERYSRKELTEIWTDESRLNIWLQIETLALEKMADLGLAPKEAVESVRKKGKFDVARVNEIEKEVKHDVIALLTNVAENVGPDSRYVHRGMTSSDVLDTALAVQLKRSTEIILKDIDELIKSLKVRAEEFKYTPCIGRSHGIHAEPITFGLKLISWYAEMKRHKKRILAALEDVAVGKISGAVGTYASVPPEVEVYVMQKLGLKAETVSSQIVQRDRHAAYFSALALLASSIEKFSTEVRHLQRSEVREVEEKFSSGQKGSSAMPHKRNPVLTENLCGLARLVRSYSLAAMENVALWHERDISHSSVERVISPDACTLIDFMLYRFNSVIQNLVVYPERMLENLESSRGLVFSGTLLNMLVEKNVTREEAYSMVQKHALEAWAGGANLKERVKQDKQITGLLDKNEIDSAFDLKRHTEHVDYIFERAIKE
jgi:adenylosuccinate lyase